MPITRLKTIQPKLVRSYDKFGFLYAGGVACILVTDKLFGAMMALLLIFGLITPQQKHYHALKALDYTFIALLCLYPFSIIIQMLLRGSFLWSEFDNPSRFFLVIPIYILMRTYGTRLNHCIYGAIIGCILTGIFTCYELVNTPGIRVGGSDNEITYAQVAFLLLTIACIPPLANVAKPIKGKKIFLFFLLAIGSITIVAAQVRGVFIIMPLLLLACTFFHQYYSFSKIELAALSATLLLLGYFLLNSPHFPHISALLDELSKVFIDNNLSAYDSSRHRIELWKASIDLFASNPWFGVGKGHFNEALNLQAATDSNISKDVLRYTHAHHELLHLASEVGVIGVLSIAAPMIMLPYLCFKNGFNNESRYIVAIVTTSWFLFGLTSTPLAHHKITLLILILLCTGFAHGMNQKFLTLEDTRQ